MTDPDVDVPVGLYIAAYGDASGAQADWDGLKQLQSDGLIEVDGMVLVSRDAEGKIDVRDTEHAVAKGAGWGAVGGAVIGLIFPPAILGSAAVGAAVGAGAGGLVSHGDKLAIKEDIEDVMPNNSSGIVAMLESQWAAQVKKALANADKVTERDVDSASASELKQSLQSD